VYASNQLLVDFDHQTLLVVDLKQLHASLASGANTFEIFVIIDLNFFLCQNQTGKFIQAWMLIEVFRQKVFSVRID